MKSNIQEDVILYDWITVSCREEDPYFFVRLLEMEGAGWEEMNHGRHGYRNGIFCGNISILYDGNEGMGSCLDMSGQGCRCFEEKGSGDYDGLFRLIQDNPEHFNLTRLDVVFDDHSGVLDIQQLFHDTDRREFISKFRKEKIEKSFTDGRPGISVYHGSSKSAILVRIYDKAAERDLSSEQHWVRVELQLRDERALAFIASPLEIGRKFRGVLANYVRYVVDDSSDTNRWRWPMKGYWSDLLDRAERITLYVKPGLEYNLSRLDNYVFGQASAAISAAMEIHGHFDFFQRLKTRDPRDIPKYARLINLYGPKRHTTLHGSAADLQKECHTAEGEGKE